MAGVAFVHHPDYLRHETGQHPERPARLAAVAAAVEAAALPGVAFVSPVAATPEQVLRVHTLAHLERLARLAAAGGGFVQPDTPVSPASLDVALLAAGGAVRAVEAVLRGGARAAFAAVRPPGHHAFAAQGGGFCLLNNVAIAARHAQAASGLRRVMIVDFDVHHGNGTEAIFEDDPTVLYCSVHEYPLYPGTGAARDVGWGAGRGYTVNVPVPAGVGDAELAQVFDEVVGPVARRFRPELLLVSAGYDGHWRDPLALLELSAAGYGALVARLAGWAAELCGGRLALVLEGGYRLEALAASVVASLAALAGVPVPDPLGPRPDHSPVDLAPAIAEVRRAHPRWLT